MIDSAPELLTFSQERMWFLQMLDPQDRSYQFQATLALDGKLDTSALERALGEIVRRHTIFRTRFVSADGTPMQIVESQMSVDLRTADISQAVDPAAALIAAIDAATERPFDLTRLPLVRWTLVRVSAERHVLVHVEHHIIHDGWSFYVFLGELAALYRAYAAGTQARLAPAPAFAEFARARRAAAETTAAAEQLAYWKRKLDGAPALLHLPTDAARPPVQTHAGDAVVRELPLATLRGLEGLSRSQRVTVFMTALSAFAVLLQRYSGDTDICVGTGVAGRESPEVEQLIGMVINNVILRIDLSGDPTFSELVDRVKQTAIAAYANQHVPLDRIVAAVAPVRDPSFNPLFSTMFSFHDAPYPELDFGGLSPTLDMTVGNASAKMDLNIIALPHKSGITVKWEYNSALFERETMVRMFDHFEALLAAIVDEPERRISRFALMSAGERQTILDDFASNPQPYDRECGIATLFERTVARSPDAPALVTGDAAITYGELDRRANRLAHYLHKHGVETGSRVATLFERSADAVVAMLAVLKAGGVYVPLSTRYPGARIAWILEDAAIDLTLVHESTHLLLPPSADVIAIDARAADIERERDDALPRAERPEALAHLIYTSGSTGTPKGVCVTHRGVVRLVAPGTEIEIRSDDVVAHYASYAFDASTLEIWGALLNGAALAIVPAGMLSLAELGRALERVGTTVAFLTTPLFHQMVESRQPALGKLRLLIVGGDTMSPSHALRFVEEYDSCRLINGYGPTENTTFTTYHEVTRASARRRSISIGHPIANTTVYVLDTHRKPVPIDVPGEIYTGGDGVASGYLNRPELTAERFVADPFAREADARLYRTGDLGRWRSDGTVEFFGRSDDQVKVRGFRIELGAVEAALRSYPEIREAAVSVATTGDGEKLLIAHVVPGHDGLDQQQIRGFLSERLPEYEVPSRITIVAALPSGVSGKIDRVRLAGGALRGAVEERLGELWIELLGVTSVTRDDDFFDSGGHSLLAMRMLAHLNAAFDVDIRLHEIFEHRTIAALGAAIERAPQSSAPSTLGTLSAQRANAEAAVGPKVDGIRLAGGDALRGAVEERLGELWIDLLGVTSVARDDDFFDLGGHSLLAMRLLALINAAFHVEIRLQQIFEHRTIATLAAAIERAPKTDATATLGTMTAQSAIADAAVAEVASLSDAEIDALLAGDLAEVIKAESLS